MNTNNVTLLKQNIHGVCPPQACIWLYTIDKPTVYAPCRYPFGFILLTHPRCILPAGMHLGIYY